MEKSWGTGRRIVSHTGIRYYRNVGDAIAVGSEHKRSPRERRFFYMISHKNADDACGLKHKEWKF